MLFGVNFQRGKQTGSYGTNAGMITNRTNLPLNLNAGSFSNVDEDVSFSPVFEWRFDAAYNVGQHARARIGYTGILFGGISRGATSIDYTLPSFGMSLSDDAVVFNALTFGFDVAF